MTTLANFDRLGKRYGDLSVVDDLSFDVPEGSVIGLLGPNGAGKTTSIKMLLGLARPTAGKVRLLGHAPGTSGFTGALRQVGSLIEGPALFSRASARDNLRIEAAARGVDAPKRRIDELLDLVGLTSRADSPAGQFSLGMKQRLGLAVALVPSPRLVVLDEPTNGLDPSGIVEVRNLIKTLPERGTTVLVSSHQLAEVQLMCHRAAILHRGRLVTEGTIDELLGTHGQRGFTVAVDAADRDRAAGVLTAEGLAPEPLADGRMAVAGSVGDGTAISRPLGEQGIYVSELVPQSATLEQVFLDLTGDAPSDPDHAGAPALQEVV